jgi:hypothetical protein
MKFYVADDALYVDTEREGGSMDTTVLQVPYTRSLIINIHCMLKCFKDIWDYMQLRTMSRF